jgi:hypothetical protein
MSKTNKSGIQIPENQSKTSMIGLNEVDVNYWNYSVNRQNITDNVTKILLGEHPIATRPLKLLFSQQTACDVLKHKYLITMHVSKVKFLSTYQCPLLKPKAVIGEQVKPTATSGATTRPMSSSIRERTDESALVTELPIWSLSQQSRLK